MPKALLPLREVEAALKVSHMLVRLYYNTVQQSTSITNYNWSLAKGPKLSTESASAISKAKTRYLLWQVGLWTPVSTRVETALQQRAGVKLHSLAAVHTHTLSMPNGRAERAADAGLLLHGLCYIPASLAPVSSLTRSSMPLVV
jgi:hypothetical protein